MKKHKLDLKALELEIPSLSENESRFILGGNDYHDIEPVVIIGEKEWAGLYDFDDVYDGPYHDTYDNYDNGERAESEQAWALENPWQAVKAYYNADKAGSATQDMPGAHNGFGDAARHAYWMALNTESMGADLARELGLLHEQGSASQAETNMDLHNNEWGINYANTHEDWDFADFMDAFWQAVANGEIIIIDQDTIPNQNQWGN